MPSCSSPYYLDTTVDHLLLPLRNSEMIDLFANLFLPLSRTNGKESTRMLIYMGQEYLYCVIALGGFTLSVDITSQVSIILK